MLNDMRIGKVSEPSARLLRSLARPVVYLDEIIPTEIFPLRRYVDACNKRHLDRLAGEFITFKSRDMFGCDHHGVQIPPSKGRPILDRIVAPVVQLKVE